MSFFKKHYKKFLIFCSLAILGFTFIFAKPTKASAMGFYSNDSSYFLNGSISYDFALSTDSFVNIDLPTTTSTSEFLYYLTVDGVGNIPITQTFTRASHPDLLFIDGYSNIFSLINFGFGDSSFFIDDLLLISSVTTDVADSNFFFTFDGESTDTVFYTVSFDFISFDSSSQTFITDNYTTTGSVSALGYFYPFQSFILSDPLALSYYYITNIHIDLQTDFSGGLYFSLSTLCSDSSSSFSFLHFIDLNDFTFGLSQSEIDSIYNDGYANGVDSVDTQEYYNDGYTHASEDFLKFENLVFGVMNGFSNTIRQLLDFEIFDISVFALIGGLVAVAFGVGITIIIIKVIKIFT